MRTALLLCILNQDYLIFRFSLLFWYFIYYFDNILAITHFLINPVINE